ncbi:MAG: hypothetical protein JNL11_14650 [Bdellovibrionaceae bacterium]|nr:hypothetical protein [Pseudobdellovibrionaceae bacterium]
MIRPLLIFLFLFEIATAQQSTRSVTLEWEQIDKAVTYDLEISDTKRKPIAYKISSEAKIKINLPPGEYLFRIRAKDKRGVAGPWSGYENLGVKVGTVKLIHPPKNWEKIIQESDKVEITFKWSQSQGAEGYKVKVKSISSSFDFAQETESTELTVVVPVGETFNWSVQSKAKGLLSPISESQFTVLGKNYAKPEIIKPTSDFVRQLKWNREKSSDAVDMFVWKVDEDTQTWKKIFEKVNVSETSFVFPAEWDGGQYRLELLAKKDNKAISEKEMIEFPVRTGSRTIASENKVIMESLFKRQNVSGVFFNYILSQISYKTTTPYLNSASSFDAVTGTLSGGWEGLFSPNYGVRTQASLGGMVIDKSDYVLIRFEVNGLYRQQMSDVSDSRIFMGLYYNEIPETHISLSGIKNEVKLSKVYGLNLGADYWRAVYGFWGVKTYFTYSMPMSGTSGFGTSLKNGAEISLGVGGSYRFEKNKIYSFGYRYKTEFYEYASPKPNFDQNKIDLTGHYFNFDYNWEFE